MSRWVRLGDGARRPHILEPGSLAWRQAEQERQAMDAQLGPPPMLRRPGELPGRAGGLPLGRRALRAGLREIDQLLAQGQSALGQITQLKRESDQRIARWNDLPNGSPAKLEEARGLVGLLRRELELHRVAESSVQAVVERGRGQGTPSESARQLLAALRTAGQDTAEDLASLQGYVELFSRG